jgi:hypothetical protein
MKLITGYAAFALAPGDVVSHRGNQVEMSIFGRGRSQMKAYSGAAFGPQKKPDRKLSIFGRGGSQMKHEKISSTIKIKVAKGGSWVSKRKHPILRF